MQSDKHLHIITFNIPYPPSYGGIIDVFYKIEALAASGIRIHLHVFCNGIKPDIPELNILCSEVFYYSRKKLLYPFSIKKPLMVQTRRSKKLLANLLKDNYPVFFEGLHCTDLLCHPALKGKRKIVRMHNIEHIYYSNLAKVESNPAKRYYFRTESNRLKKYEKILNCSNNIAAISPSDNLVLDALYGNSFYLPVFHPNKTIVSETGRGNYVLYHGNLGIGENNKSALFIVNELFNDLDIQLVIAGSNPSKKLKKAIAGKNNIKLVNDVSTGEIYNLLRNAQINLMLTFQATGIKLKLINSLFQGRFCIANTDMVKDTGFEDLCLVADSPAEIKNLIKKYFETEFGAGEIEKRKIILENNFNNHLNAEKLIMKVYDSK